MLKLVPVGTDPDYSGKAAMQAVAARLERHPELSKYDILINPVLTA